MHSWRYDPGEFLIPTKVRKNNRLADRTPYESLEKSFISMIYPES
jgi:hypothetical protein